MVIKKRQSIRLWYTTRGEAKVKILLWKYE